MTKKILVGIVALVILGLIIIGSNIVMYRTYDRKTVQRGTMINYKDEKFAYSFSYPSTWIKDNGSVMDQGYISISSSNDLKTQIQFWFKDTEKIENIDKLVEYVK